MKKWYYFRYIIYAGIANTLIFCKSANNYPCPPQTSRMAAQFDSTGAFSGGYRHNVDKKTGLIKRKKNKNLMDKKR
ncbi:MAG: hypothetical protein NW207_06840 [Cytophagales bacterium]|nr:hypothetical protein [Cytophagales bacterium]